MRQAITKRIIVLGAVVLVSAACAGRRAAADAAFAPEATTSDPQLVECAGYRPAPGGVGPIRAVDVQYLVKADGLVDASSITIVKRPQAEPKLQAELEQRARDAARNCHYAPGLRDGQPVATMVRRTFRFVI